MHQPVVLNRFLSSLPSEDAEQLRPGLVRMHLEKGMRLCEPGQPVTSVYFPHDGLVSMVVHAGSGEPIEVANVGRDSLVGAGAALGCQATVLRAVVQIGGPALVIDADAMAAVAERSAALRGLLVRHQQFLLAQAQQTAACNALHAIEARLARYLLRCRDLLCNEEICLTQDTIADILGVRRTSISLVAGTMQNAGLISYRRGRIRVTNVAALQAAACECHRAVDTHFANLFPAQPAALAAAE